MGHVCSVDLAKKISVYVLLARNMQVTVTRQSNLGKCDLCDNPAVYIVSYIPKELNDEGANNCKAYDGCTCGIIDVTACCPVHPTYIVNGTAQL